MFICFFLYIFLGLLVVPNPFATGGQHGWVRRCLVDYPCRPNACNLDAHSERSGDGRLWPSHTTASGDGLATQSGVPGEGGGQKAHANKRLKLSKDDLLHRLRWVTLGYHYDWTNKVQCIMCYEHAKWFSTRI